MTLGFLFACATRSNIWQKVAKPSPFAHSFCESTKRCATNGRGTFRHHVTAASDVSCRGVGKLLAPSSSSPQPINFAEEHRTNIILNRLFPFQVVVAGAPFSVNHNGVPLHVMNRNARRPKKANKGKRPCSRTSRRSKKERYGKRSRS